MQRLSERIYGDKWYSMHVPLCGIFHPNSVAVANYGVLIRAKSPTNCDAHLAESLFQTRSGNQRCIMC